MTEAIAADRSDKPSGSDSAHAAAVLWGPQVGRKRAGRSAQGGGRRKGRVQNEKERARGHLHKHAGRQEIGKVDRDS